MTNAPEEPAQVPGSSASAKKALDLSQLGSGTWAICDRLKDAEGMHLQQPEILSCKGPLRLDHVSPSPTHPLLAVVDCEDVPELQRL